MVLADLINGYNSNLYGRNYLNNSTPTNYNLMAIPYGQNPYVQNNPYFNAQITDTVSFGNTDAPVLTAPQTEKKSSNKTLLFLGGAAAIVLGAIFHKDISKFLGLGEKLVKDSKGVADDLAKEGGKLADDATKTVENVVVNTEKPTPKIEETIDEIVKENKNVDVPSAPQGVDIQSAMENVQPVIAQKTSIPVTKVLEEPSTISNPVISKQVIEPQSVQAGNLPIENRRVLFAYKGTGYVDANMNLRSGLPLSEAPSIKISKDKKYSVKDLVNIIDDSFEYAVPTKNDIILHRGETFYDNTCLTDLLEKAKGGHIQFKAYTSTSHSKDIAIGNFSAGMDATLSGVNAVRYKIKLPKGSRVLDYSSLNLDHGGEMEVLLPRNANFKVLKINEPYAEDITKIAQQEGKSIDSYGKLLDIELEYIP